MYTCAHLAGVFSLLGSDWWSHPPLWCADMRGPSQLSMSEADLEARDDANWARKAEICLTYLGVLSAPEHPTLSCLYCLWEKWAHLASIPSGCFRISVLGEVSHLKSELAISSAKFPFES